MLSKVRTVLKFKKVFISITQWPWTLKSYWGNSFAKFTLRQAKVFFLQNFNTIRKIYNLCCRSKSELQKKTTWLCPKTFQTRKDLLGGIWLKIQAIDSFSARVLIQVTLWKFSKNFSFPQNLIIDRSSWSVSIKLFINKQVSSLFWRMESQVRKRWTTSSFAKLPTKKNHIKFFSGCRSLRFCSYIHS